MLPNQCTIKDKNGDCPNSPSFLISITHNSEEYMISVVCEEHKVSMEKRVINMQNIGDLMRGTIKLVPLRPVGTDCVLNYPEKMA